MFSYALTKHKTTVTILLINNETYYDKKITTEMKGPCHVLLLVP